MADVVPLFRTASRAEAVDILRRAREVTDTMIAGLPPARLTTPSALGDGSWSIKDLIGHLATWEERALVVLEVRPPSSVAGAATTDEFNAFHLERKRAWSLARVRKDAAAVRAELLGAIEGLDDERWSAKMPNGQGGRSALGLVVGKVLGGGRYGYFAHDLAHVADLKKAVS